MNIMHMNKNNSYENNNNKVDENKTHLLVGFIVFVQIIRGSFQGKYHLISRDYESLWWPFGSATDKLHFCVIIIYEVLKEN